MHSIHMLGMIAYSSSSAFFSSVSASIEQWATIAALHHASSNAESIQSRLPSAEKHIETSHLCRKHATKIELGSLTT